MQRGLLHDYNYYIPKLINGTFCSSIKLLIICQYQTIISMHYTRSLLGCILMDCVPKCYLSITNHHNRHTFHTPQGHISLNIICQ